MIAKVSELASAHLLRSDQALVTEVSAFGDGFEVAHRVVSVPDDADRGCAAQHRTLDHRRRLARVEPDVGEQVQNRVDRTLQLDLGNELADAHVRTEAETKRRLLPPIDIECIGILEYRLVAVGRG